MRHTRRIRLAVLWMSVTVSISACGAEGEGSKPDRSPSISSSAEASPTDDEFEAEFRKIVARVPGWSIADVQEMFHNAPCTGNWSSAAEGASGGNFDVSTNGEPGQAWHEVIGFASVANASDAADRLVENLASCETAEWQAKQVGQTGAVLASSAHGLIWVRQNGRKLGLLVAATTDGPPPQKVQVEIADLVRPH